MTRLESVEHETGPSPAWSIVWLHGLGADGHDFAPIVPELVRAIQWSDIYNLLERATDRAEDVAVALEAIVVKHA